MTAFAHAQVQFGKTLRFLRLRRKITSQEKLAELAGLHINFISRAERGKVDVSLSTIIKLSRALRVPIPTLLKGIR
jgi:transcriptional regulator with XRE-family HTH domain